MATGPVLSYAPPPNELPYYDELFSVADKERSGQLNGREAVAFLARSKLPVDLLKNIWTMADQNPKTNSLDRGKFNVAVRLIQLFQNGQKAQGTNLLAAPGVTMRPPFFEGVSDTIMNPPSSVASPAHPPVGYVQPNLHQQPIPQMQSSPPQVSSPRSIYSQQQQVLPTQHHQQAHLMQHQQSSPKQQEQPSMALATQDPYAMLPGEQGRYESLFPQYETHHDGYVYGKEAVELFSKSGLPKEVLREIWNMADDPVDNRLDSVEFAIAMHLIVCVSKKKLSVPPGLPLSLQGLKGGQQIGGLSGRIDSLDSSVNNPRQLQQQRALPPAPVSIPSPSMAPQKPPFLPMGSMGMPNVSVMTPQVGSQSYVPPPLQQSQFGPRSGLPPIQQGQFGVGLYGQHMSSGESVSGGTTAIGGDTTTAGGPYVNTTGGASISDAFNDLNSDTAAAAAGAYGVSAPADITMSYKDGPPQQDNVRFSSFPTATPPGEISFDKRKEDDLKQRMSTLTFRPPSPGTSGLPPRASLPPSRTTPSGNATGKTSNFTDSDSAELSKLRTELQKLQAENISLKAQLGQLSDDELNVRREITETISDIGTLSQQLTGLRNQFATAKASLIEATAELKAHLEKKDTMKDLISDALGTMDVLNSSTVSVKDAIKSATANKQNHPAPSATFESSLFDFGASDPSPGFIETSKNDDALNEDSDEDDNVSSDKFNSAPTGANTYFSAGQPVASGISTGDTLGGASTRKQALHRGSSTQSVEPMGGSSLAAQTNLGSNAQSFGHFTASFASSQTAKEAQKVKFEVEKAEKEAGEAEDHARALSLQLNDLNAQADAAEAVAQEKQVAVQSMKKGFGRSTMKRSTKKEADLAMQEALDKRRFAQEVQKEAAEAQAEAISKKRQADLLRYHAEEAEMQIAKSESAAEAQGRSELTDADTSKFNAPMNYGGDNKRFEAFHGSGAAPIGYRGPSEDSGNSSFSNSPSRMPVFGSVDQTTASPGSNGMGGYSSGQRNQTVGTSGMSSNEKVMGGGTTMGYGIGMGGVMGGISTGDSVGGIPSPGNSVSGDDYNNPFGAY